MSITDQMFGTEEVKKNGTRILLVDDEPAYRELTGDRLEMVGFEVEKAGDGYEALEKLKQFHYDAIVMDTKMPGMFGYEVCSEVRKAPLGQRLAILGMSSQANFKHNWDEADVDVFIDKKDILDSLYVLENNIYAAVAYRRGI